MSDPLLEPGQLDKAIAALEQLRGIWKDAQVDEEIAKLRQTAHAKQTASNPQTTLGDRAVYVDGNNRDVNTGVIINMTPSPGAGKEELRRAFLERLLERANQLPLFKGDNTKNSIRLASVYTALLTQGGDAEAKHSRIVSPSDHSRSSVLDRLNQERKLVLLGGPGSGKSTFINFLSVCMAGAWLGDAAANLQTLTAPIPPEPHSRDQPKPQHWEHGALLPVPVVLRDFASELAGKAVNAETLWQHIESQLRQASLGEFAPHLRAELLDEGGLILLDGLDEVPESENRREQIKQAVQDFAYTFQHCRFLATSRTYAYTRQDWKLQGFAESVLLPFSAGQIKRFVTAWYQHMTELERLTARDAEGKAALLKRTIARNARLQELAEQPLLLTLIARLQTEKGGNLPEKRERLYAEAVDMLLTQWENLKVIDRANGDKIILDSLSEWLKASPDDIRTQLDKLAFEAHRDQADMKGTADISQGRLFEALLAATPQKNVNHQRLEEHLRDRTGLLAAHGERLYQFPHRTFQEYLAACHLTNAGFPEELAELARTEPGRWREATLLAAAKVSRGTAKSVWDLVEALCFQDIPQGQSPQTADLWGALLAGQALWETGLAEAQDTAKRHQPKRERVRLWLQAIVENGWLPPVDRAKAGQALSVLGDGRELTALVSIPEGEFWLGDDQLSDARPRHRLKLPAFQIGRYPVTNGQYEKFIQATGRRWPSPEAGKPERRNHPAIFVSWHDALAYCHWLTKTEQGLRRIGPDQAYTLPSEAEWERAAAGPAGLKFPWCNDWRDDHANTRESGLGETSAVGLFPNGRSPEGCLDMAGNVYEWTRSLWGKDRKQPDYVYPYPQQESQRAVRENLQAGNEIYRVVRGGSWDNSQVNSRCAVRLMFQPNLRIYYSGFRVVLCSGSVV